MLKQLFYQCVRLAYEAKVGEYIGVESPPVENMTRGLSVQDKTMLLMKFIQNKEVVFLLYETMKDLHKT